MKDTFGLPLLEGDTHIIALWYSSDKKERSARLKGATFGEPRKTKWNELIRKANEKDEFKDDKFEEKK